MRGGVRCFKTEEFRQSTHTTERRGRKKASLPADHSTHARKPTLEIFPLGIQQPTYGEPFTACGLPYELLCQTTQYPNLFEVKITRRRGHSPGKKFQSGNFDESSSIHPSCCTTYSKYSELTKRSAVLDETLCLKATVFS